jgi:PAS domain S-box-containing protein
MAADDELHRAQDSLDAKTRALAQSEAMLQATLESTTDGILVTDEDGRIISCNQNYAQMTGVSSETMASAHYQRVLDVAARLVRDPEAFQARVAEIVTKSPAETYDVLELVDGRVIDLFSKVLVVEGRRSGRVWSFRDVTERRHADDARRDETRILEIVNETGVTLSSSLDVRTLLQTVTDATTTRSGARFGAFFYNTVDANGDAYMLYTLSGAPREAFEHFGTRARPALRSDLPRRRAHSLRRRPRDPRYGRMDAPACHRAICRCELSRRAGRLAIARRDRWPLLRPPGRRRLHGASSASSRASQPRPPSRSTTRLCEAAQAAAEGASSCTSEQSAARGRAHERAEGSVPGDVVARASARRSPPFSAGRRSCARRAQSRRTSPRARDRRAQRPDAAQRSTTCST